MCCTYFDEQNKDTYFYVVKYHDCCTWGGPNAYCCPTLAEPGGPCGHCDKCMRWDEPYWCNTTGTLDIFSCYCCTTVETTGTSCTP